MFGALKERCQQIEKTFPVIDALEVYLLSKRGKVKV